MVLDTNEGSQLVERCNLIVHVNLPLTNPKILGNPTFHAQNWIKARAFLMGKVMTTLQQVQMMNDNN